MFQKGIYFIRNLKDSCQVQSHHKGALSSLASQPNQKIIRKISKLLKLETSIKFLISKNLIVRIVTQ